MSRRKRQQRLGKDFDRLSVIVSTDLGNRIRKMSDKKGVSISNFLASAAEEKLDELAGEIEGGKTD